MYSNVYSHMIQYKIFTLKYNKLLILDEYHLTNYVPQSYIFFKAIHV